MEQRCSYQHVGETFEHDQSWHQSPNDTTKDLPIEWSTWKLTREAKTPVVGSSSSSNPWEQLIYNYPTVGETTYQPPIHKTFDGSSSSYVGHDDDVYRPQFSYPQPSICGQSVGVDSMTSWLLSTTISTP
ncbi:hypothetical protein V6N13_024520 [Hibiscus sabdariffa]|uniref:Uncharacterized protein n=2 Tax=Hibiscus sabdariffa TaxID=183260 RepID=A0ABR1ZP07_9ROSI